MCVVSSQIFQCLQYYSSATDRGSLVPDYIRCSDPLVDTLIGPLGRCVGASNRTTIVLFAVVVFWGYVVHLISDTLTFDTLQYGYDVGYNLLSICPLCSLPI